jgi:hypothetical protein
LAEARLPELPSHRVNIRIDCPILDAPSVHSL